jgi:hypothetical protein
VFGDSKLAGDYRASAKQAVQDLLDFKYDYKDTYRVPKSENINSDFVEAGAVAAKGVLGRGTVDRANLDAADKEMKLTPQERALYERHLTNLTGPGGVNNPDGSRSTLFQTSFESGGRTYNVPTVYDGKILSPKDAIDRAYREGIDKFPSYGSENEAEARYQKMHGYMEKDTAAFLPFALAPVADPRFPGRSPEDIASDYAARLRRNGVWLTDAKEHGLVLYHPDGSPARRADGERVALSWAQLEQMGRDAAARQRRDNPYGPWGLPAGPQ